jgi:NADPH-dependent 2,4-dienoyl-CoA reductase/sulfur reductase-like enzyme
MNREQVVVVGAGAAGTAAAFEAAARGLSVTLVDEHPVDLNMMGLDTPYFFGPRLMPTLGDRGVMLERIISSNEALRQADEAGVKLQLGTRVWGSFGPGENNRQQTSRSLGLADAERSWLLDYDHLILAPGARDLVLSFPGCELPGVLGAQGANALMTRYRALSARRLVIFGSGALGLETARRALEHGAEVVGIVDVAPNVQGAAELWTGLAGSGIPFFGGHVVQAVDGDKEVQGVRLVRLDAAMQPIAGRVTELACDTVCLALGLVPSIELAYLTGCRVRFRGDLGGWIPDRNDDLRTSVAQVFVTGDAAGVHDAMITAPHIAAGQGRRAAIAVAGDRGVLTRDRAHALKQEVAPVHTRSDDGAQVSNRSAWVQSSVAAGGLDVTVCQCESVTRRELLEVRPPKYLAWSPPRTWTSKMPSISGEAGSAHPDQLKRLTRAGMGHCQGRRCREQVALLLAHAAGVDVSAIPLASYRPPVRPLPMKVLWPEDEPEELRQEWTSWFRPWIPGSAEPESKERRP